MISRTVFSGFGGQGVLLMGYILSHGAMRKGLDVTYFPAYGAEMRGGTANCTVIISDTKISSPIVTRFDVVVALNQPSLDKFEKAVKPGGILLYDSTTIIHPPTRTDITIVPVPASEEAVKLKNSKTMNMIVLGAVLEQTNVVTMESVLQALKKVLPERYHHLLPLNEQALRRGMQLAAEPQPA